MSNRNRTRELEQVADNLRWAESLDAKVDAMCEAIGELLAAEIDRLAEAEEETE